MPKSRLPMIATFLFLSGLCALVLQNAWLRELRLVFGVSTAASAAVLAVFMAGLGAGGLFFGRRADRAQRPLALYGTLETLVAVSSAATPFLVDLARLVYTGLGGVEALGGTGSTLVRLALSVVVLGFPTFLMGGTLPAAARAAVAEDDDGRRGLSLLYGINTIGAVTGAAAATFLLLEVLGARRMLWSACALNALVGYLAIRADRRDAACAVEAPVPDPVPLLHPPAPSSPPRSSAPPLRPLRERPAPRPFVLAAAAIAGFAFLLMELTWYRMLAPILGGSSYTFGLILALALLGIGMGGLAAGSLRRNRPATLAGFAIASALEALVLIAPLAAGDATAFLAMFLRPVAAAGFAAQVASWAFVASLVVLPAAFLSGVQFPLLLSLLGRGRDGVGTDAGAAYAWNTAGCIAGSLAGGFGLIPLLGAVGTWRLAAVALALLSIVAVVLHLRRAARTPLAPAALVAALAAIGLSAAQGPTAVWRHSGIGVGRATLSSQTRNGLREWSDLRRRSTAFEADGIESAVALTTGDSNSLVINGKSDGSAILDAGTTVMGGLVGAILHPRPRSALVVGLGLGSTAGWLGVVPSIERVRAVELEPAVLEIAAQCAPVTEDVLANPRVDVVLGDARELLLTTPETYDIVYSQPSNPYRAGVSSLFTQEFYSAVRGRLNPGGFFLQWLQAYEVDAPTVETVYATLSNVFPVVETWQTQTTDLLLVATDRPVDWDVPRLRDAVARGDPARALRAAWRATDLEGFLAHRLAGPALATAVAGVAPDVDTDDRPRIEFGFARSVGLPPRFDAARIRAVARALGDDRPPLTGGEVDWDRVDAERLTIEFLDGRRARPDPGAADRVQGRAAALNAWTASDPAGVRAALADRPVETLDVLERTILADALADAGDSRAVPLVRGARVLLPVEDDLVLGRLAFRLGDLDGAASLLASAFIRHRATPWPLHELVRRALHLAVDLANAHPPAAPILVDALAEPFSVRSLDEERVGALLSMLSRTEPGPSCTGFLRAIEPRVPWQRRVLAWRAACYRAHGTADDAARAEDELRDFLEGEAPVFGREISALRAPGP